MARPDSHHATIAVLILAVTVVAAVLRVIALSRPRFQASRARPSSPSSGWRRSANRDLFWGVGGKRLAPDPNGRYTVIEIKRSGYSRGYTRHRPRRQRP